MKRYRFLAWILVLMIVAGCAPAAVSEGRQMEQASLATATAAPSTVTATAAPAASTPPPTLTAAPTRTPLPSASPAPPVFGPQSFPEGINPLTGLPVKDPQTLTYPPALISVTNWPLEARPQAGLSYAPFVFEVYIGEGSTRYLALFYGDFPAAVTTGDATALGPVRSGRLVYEPLRKMFHGFLVMASAYSKVSENLSEFNNVFGSDTEDINSAMVPVSKLEEIARASKYPIKPGFLYSYRFDSQPPAGGKNAPVLWLPYSYYNQIFWRYDAASAAYHRFQDRADGKTFVEDTDRLNGQALTYENVVVLFAEHTRYAETLIDINLEYIKRQPALLFRDGKMYEIYWTTRSESYERKTGLVRPLRFEDAQGNPVALHPGQTWVEVVPTFTPYYETVDADYLKMAKQKTPGSGIWSVLFYVPELSEKKFTGK